MQKYYQDYFKQWTPNMSYILGFILGDGNIKCKGYGNSRNYQICIKLNEKDLEILEFIKKEISPHRKIYYRNYKDKRTNKIYNSIELVLCSKKLVYDIINLGIKPNKSGNEQLIDIPNKFYSHFLRGLFDADGHVRQCSNKTSYEFKIDSASEKLVCDLKDSFGFGKVIHRKLSGCYKWSVCDKKHILNLFKFIYKDSKDSFYLNRKFNIFKTI